MIFHRISVAILITAVLTGGVLTRILVQGIQIQPQSALNIERPPADLNNLRKDLAHIVDTILRGRLPQPNEPSLALPLPYGPSKRTVAYAEWVKREISRERVPAMAETPQEISSTYSEFRKSLLKLVREDYFPDNTLSEFAK